MDGGQPRTSQQRILWADEAAGQAERARALLASKYVVDVAGDAEAVFACVRERAPVAVACVSAAMRTHDGVPLARALRALPALARAAILLICPRGHELRCPDALLDCVDDLLLAPFSDRELSLRVRSHARAAGALDILPVMDLHALDHDVRTPLTAIQLWASTLRAGALDEAGLARAVRAISASAHGQARRIDDLLDIARLARGALDLHRCTVSAALLLQEVSGEAEPLAEARQVELELAQAEQLGTIEVDPRRMRQVLSNLLASAIKLGSKGGRVRLTARRDGQALEFELRAPADAPARDGPPPHFVREPGPGMDEPGLSMGLALSRCLIELHGGSLETSRTDSCTIFRMRLPQPGALPARDEQAYARPPSKRTLSGRSVLLVEDHEETLEAMQFVLERAGARVWVAENGQRALELLGASPGRSGEARCPVDAVVCDLGLPDMSGYEFVAQLSRAYQQRQLSPPPSCALSACARELDRRRAIQAGFDLHIPKPLSAEELIEAVDDLCQVTATAESASPSD